MMIDDDQAWAAFARRDRSHDGQFVVGVRTTGIYCKPSCAARRPRRDNVAFYRGEAEATAAGLRACLRCRPDAIARDQAAVRQALAMIDASTELPTLAVLGRAIGYSPAHLQRLFTSQVGVSPAAYARARRAARLERALDEEDSVTTAIYAAGYSGPARVHADSRDRLGMTPSAWRNGGRGVTIRWAVVETVLGPMLLAATDKGICRLSFDEDAAALTVRFAHATIVPGGPEMTALVDAAVAAVAQPALAQQLPLDVAGTAFQQAVWQELRRIPPGETRSYAQVAAAIGTPAAVRATGSANGANNVAVLIPCHRVVRSDGGVGGYAYGVERKTELLRRERLAAEPGSDG